MLLLILLGGGAYFARPYLPGWLVTPVERWIRGLPSQLGLGHAVSARRRLPTAAPR